MAGRREASHAYIDYWKSKKYSAVLGDFAYRVNSSARICQCSYEAASRKLRRKSTELRDLLVLSYLTTTSRGLRPPHIVRGTVTARFPSREQAKPHHRFTKCTRTHSEC